MEHGQEDMDKCGIVLEYKVSRHCTYITYTFNAYAAGTCGE